jgi:type IV pilus assembly protein PilX
MTKGYDMNQSITSSMIRRSQAGASMLMVLMILAVVSLLGVAGVQISLMSERGARNDRDMQLAWQGAEAALIDAEFDIFGPVVTSTRRPVFGATPKLTSFINGCGTTGDSVGLCSLVSSGKPAWVSANYTDTSATSNTTRFGTFTGRSFEAGGPGVQPALAPRYVIEPIRDPNDRDLANTEPKYVYRVTAMGFGPRADIQAVIQMIYRI